MNYGPDALRDVLAKERDLRTFFQNVAVALREGAPPAAADQRWGADEKEVQASIREAHAEVRGRESADERIERCVFSAGTDGWRSYMHPCELPKSCTDWNEPRLDLLFRR